MKLDSDGWENSQQDCLAIGKIYDHCQLLNLFENVWRSKQVLRIKITVILVLKIIAYNGQ